MLQKLLPGVAALALLMAPALGAADSHRKTTKNTKSATTMSSDMQRAIAWEHYKDMAAARQARLEARHPSVPAPSSAERSIEQPNEGRPVKDPGPAPRKNPK